MNGIIIDELSSVELPVQSGDEFPIERGQAMYKVDYDDLIGDDLSAINGDISDLQTNVNGLQSNVTKAQTSINALESGIAIIVNGNSAARTVPSGGYAYLKNNQYGLAEGLYININSADFPTGSSVAATSSYFSPVSGGGLNTVFNAIAWEDITGQCTFNYTINQSGLYRTFVWLNKLLKIVYFAIEPLASVNNQSLLFTLPSSITPAFSQGYCGLGQSSTSIGVGARLNGQSIYSSHTAVSNAANVGYVGLIPLA